MKIINVGTYPPPIGGVSVYLMRLHKNLLSKKMNAYLIDISKTVSHDKNVLHFNEWKMFFYLLFFQKKSILHFHVFSLKLNFLYFLLSLRHITILTFHNERFYGLIKSKGNLIFNLHRLFLNRFDRLIVLNKKCEKLANNFVRKSNQLLIINNFITPLDKPEIFNKRILELRKNHTFVISSNAWKISFYKDQDLYGIDILIEMMKKIVTRVDVIFLFALPNIADEHYFAKLNQKAKKYNLENKFIFITEPLNGPGLWQISDLVIRATNTDGSSLTVKEALNLGTPVLASDCVERPKEAVLFKTRDVQDLTIKTQEILTNLPKYRKKLIDASVTDDLQLLLNLYENLLKTNHNPK